MKDVLDKKYELSLLYDFYGELLKEHHKVIFEDYFLNDLSLSEIAEEQGISRQGVHDIIKRSSKLLEDYESKLRLKDKYVNIKNKAEMASHILKESIDKNDFDKLSQIEDLLKDIIDVF